SFPLEQGSNTALLDRLKKLRKSAGAGPGLASDSLLKALKQVATKAAAGKSEALNISWNGFTDDIDAFGMLRPRALVLAPTRELAQQVGQ
ncbi:unnamed protein product, partial [Polarella glacialis]